jgi:iron complex outermembrane receptor protein
MPRGRVRFLAGRAAALSACGLATYGEMAHADEPEHQPVVEVRGSSVGGFSSKAAVDDSLREVTDAASLVEQTPGVHVRRLGSDDGFATLSIRGSSSNQVVVVLAGVPLTGGADPSLDLGSLPLWPGAKVRVYRTFAPAALGPGSLGGTLVVEPPSAGGVARTEIWDAVGSFGELRLRIGDVRDVGGGVRVATALSASRADDAFSFYDPTHDDFTTRQNDGHAAANGLAEVALPVPWAGGAEGTLRVTALLQARRQELPGTIDFPTPFAALDSNRELGVVELTRGAERGSAYARVWGRRDDLQVTDDATPGVFFPSHTDDGILALGGAAGWRGRVASQLRLDARADGSSERFSPGDYSGAAQPPGATRQSGGAGADLEWNPGASVAVAASGRIDALTERSDGSAARGELHPTAHLGVEAPLGPVRLAAHGGVLARAPSFVELYGNEGGVVGDPSLRAESAWSVDAGGSIALGHGPVRVIAEVAGFATWAQDLIVFVAYGERGIRAANIAGGARLFGGEGDIRARAYGFDLRAAYTALLTLDDGECSGAPSGCKPPPLPGRPANDLVGDVSYTLGPASVRYGVDWVSGMTAGMDGTIYVPARVLQSVGAHLDVPRVPGLRVGFDVRNLLDVRTGTYAGQAGPVREPIGDLYSYPLPGRTFLATVKWMTK